MTVQLLKEQNKSDRIPPELLDQLKHVLPLVERVADILLSEKTDILGKSVEYLFEVMKTVAENLCEYVRCGRAGSQLPFLGCPCADDCSENGQAERD